MFNIAYIYRKLFATADHNHDTVYAAKDHGTHVSTSSCVTSINSQKGDVTLDIPQGTVKSVNNSQPDSNGNVNVSAGTTIPRGAIMWFYITSGVAPDGWAVCDGTNGTPNLIGRYPLGATSGIGTNVAAGLPAFDGTFSVTGGMHMHLEHGTVGSSGGDVPCQTTTGGLQAISGTDIYCPEGYTVDRYGHHQPNSENTSPGHNHDVSVTYPEGSIFGSSDTVTPPSVKLLPCMKL